MVNKKMWHEEDDTLQAEIDSEIETTEKYDLLNVRLANITNGELPTSRWDQGRNCPRCAGRLVYKEHTVRNSTVLLFCKSCGAQVFAEDIDFNDEIVDKLYRTIPLNLQNKWNTHREKYREKK